MKDYSIIERKVIISTKGRLCETPNELLESKLFVDIIKRGVKELHQKNSPLTDFISNDVSFAKQVSDLTDLFKNLYKNPRSLVKKLNLKNNFLLNKPNKLKTLVEYLYNYWREFERYIICNSEDDNLDKRPYRTFNQTVENLTHLVRQVYRDIWENTLETHPKIYRQVNSGAEFACISLPIENEFLNTKEYNFLSKIPVIKQMYMSPPLILDPPMNKRKGSFIKIDENPINSIDINSEEWLCYPAKVGDLLIMIYFHQRFFELGFSSCNLFEIATDKDLNKKPDAIYLFGVPGNSLNELAESPTVFHEDHKNDVLIAACPNAKEFGYFGYLKKMVLTLHNAIKIKNKKLPFHGSLVEITLQSGKSASILMIGDSGAGKSETLEAYKELGQDIISEIKIIADDMGSIEISKNNQVIGYGTETGAFLRLDDLKPGYAFGQLDRSVIMSAGLTNARIILPATDYQTVIEGLKIDYIFYANNYEEVNEDHAVIEKINSAKDAIKIFSEGVVMSKGTTNTSGLVKSYFANIFGPPEYKDEHDELADVFFKHFFTNNVFVGQIRTQLGIDGMERTGPEIAAKELLKLIS